MLNYSLPDLWSHVILTGIGVAGFGGLIPTVTAVFLIRGTTRSWWTRTRVGLAS